MSCAKAILVFLALAFLLPLGACSSRPPVGEETIVERSGGKPALVADNQWVEIKKDRCRFVGMSSPAKELDIGIREAEIAARQRIVESIADSMRSIGSVARAGTPSQSIGRYLNDVVTWIAGSTEIIGSSLRETYWEKIAVNLGGALDYSYRTYAIVEMSRDDYDRARLAALRKTEERALADSNEEAAAIVRHELQRLQGAVP
jgi:hypothetical protein